MEKYCYMEHLPYDNIVGSVMYLMVCMHSNIAYVVSIVSRFMSNPARAHWQTIKWILCYLKGLFERVQFILELDGLSKMLP